MTKDISEKQLEHIDTKISNLVNYIIYTENGDIYKESLYNGVNNTNYDSKICIYDPNINSEFDCKEYLNIYKADFHNELEKIIGGLESEKNKPAILLDREVVMMIVRYFQRQIQKSYEDGVKYAKN